MYLTDKTKKITLLAVFTVIALVIGAAELYIPFIPGLPGIKLGVSNIVVLTAVYFFGFREALAVAIIKVVLLTFMFGNGSSCIYSFAGSLSAVAVMGILKNFSCFSPVGVSMAGSFFHVTAQIICSFFILKSEYIFSYYPVIIFCSIITGTVTGIVAKLIIERKDKLKC